MESETRSDGLVGERRGRAAAHPRQACDVEHVGALAARVLEDLYLLVYGERPVGVRAWCDRSALLMVVRLPGPLDADGAELGSMLPCEGVPELVAAAVRAQTGWRLAIGSWSVEADLGLVMIVFRLPGDPLEPIHAPAPGGPLLATSPELQAWRGARGQEAHVPSWRAWSPLPSGAAASPGDGGPERRHLKVVDD